eukprot:TRINITY_DN52597_c0_g1_i1.p1 TRINITY_DN52597_c0_g1~~TRINITY_DN52597_c0_g1_i1.p1  ORF type:complete len:100 (+),score=8.48 TRINITY_DN52597_c0_g1_i1:67-366(+)
MCVQTCACVCKHACMYVCAHSCVYMWPRVFCSMKYPRWYTESVVSSKTYGLLDDMVGSGELYKDKCPRAAKVRAEYKKDDVLTFSYIVCYIHTLTNTAR